MPMLAVWIAAEVFIVGAMGVKERLVRGTETVHNDLEQSAAYRRFKTSTLGSDMPAR